MTLSSNPSRHIVLVPASYAPVPGGVQTAVRNLAREFVRSGHRVTIITNRYPRTLKAYEEIEGIPVYRILFCGLSLPDPNPESIVKYLLLLLWLPVSLCQWLTLLNRLRPDVLNIHFAGPSCLYAYVASFLWPFRLVVSLHGADVQQLPRLSTYLRWLQRRLFEKAGAITACSSALLGESSLENSSLKSKAFVAYNGVEDLEVAKEPVPEKVPYLFAAGRLVPIKGFDLLIQAFARVRDIENLHLFIGGDGPQRSELEILIERLNLVGRVRLLGRLNPIEVRKWMRGARFVVVPSLYESFGIVALEAMTVGKAVLACRTGGIPEVMTHGETGWLVEPASPDALAEGIRYLMENAFLRPKMAAAGRKLAKEKFTWDQAAARYMEVFKQAQCRKTSMMPRSDSQGTKTVDK